MNFYVLFCSGNSALFIVKGFEILASITLNFCILLLDALVETLRITN